MTEEELIEVKPEFMGFQNKGYPGAFPPKVEAVIKRLIASPCLHLFSGVSKIGDTRIDISRCEATLNIDVFEFIKSDTYVWKWVLADPPYAITRKDRKLAEYQIKSSVSGNMQYRREISRYLQEHTENVLWFDYASPVPFGFYREKVWTWLAGGWRPVRVLTWLKRKGERLT